MRFLSDLQPRADEKLLTELPFKQGLQIYVDAWKGLLSVSVKSMTIAGAGVLAAVVASMFVTTATLVGIGSSILAFFSGLLLEHPFSSVFVLIAFVFGLIVLRARTAH
jgi:hypothetical protein